LPKKCEHKTQLRDYRVFPAINYETLLSNTNIWTWVSNKERTSKI